MKKHALRYLPLLILALLLIPVKMYFAPHPNSVASYTSGPYTSPLTPGKALYSIAMPSAQEGWAVGGAFLNKFDNDGHLLQTLPTNGLIWHDTAGNWSAFATTAQLLLSISMASANDGWAVGYAGTLLHYDGRAWTSVSSPTQMILSEVTALSANNVWAVGFSGVILHYDGTGWSLVHSPTSANLRSISLLSPDDGWIAGDHGTLLHYQNQSWQQVASPTSETLYSIRMISADESWAVGKNETILHDRAGVWYTVGTPGAFGIANPYGSTAQHTFYDIAMTSVRSGWIASTNSLLLYNHEVWNASQSGVFAPNSSYTAYGIVLYGVHMLSAQDGWAVGEMNEDILLLHYQNGVWKGYY